MEASNAKAYLRCRAWGGKRNASRENLCFYMRLDFLSSILI